MSLTDKEISHFESELPKGMAVVDFREIRNRIDFIEKYLPKGYEDKPYSIQAKHALENFIKKVRL